MQQKLTQLTYHFNIFAKIRITRDITLALEGLEDKFRTKLQMISTKSIL